MFTTYARLKTTAQKKDAPSASSVLDASSQSESLQCKADLANGAAQRVETPRPNNTGMPDNLKAGIESLSGFSMDDVRVHYNSPKPATVQALAYTQGTDIHVAPGQEKHLPHEAWHVAQQMAGRVSPTMNINGMPVNDNAALEHEADVMGEKAAQMKGFATTANKKNNNQNCCIQELAANEADFWFKRNHVMWNNPVETPDQILRRRINTGFAPNGVNSMISEDQFVAIQVAHNYTGWLKVKDVTHYVATLNADKQIIETTIYTGIGYIKFINGKAIHLEST